MEIFNPEELKKIFVPAANSHKGQNGKLLVIGGSHLFHAASLWSLKVASRIVDMVFYSSVPENNRIVEKEKDEFRDGIVVPRNMLEKYLSEADCILIGPGLPRKDGEEPGDDDTKELTEKLLKYYPEKRWVIDGGSLQVIKPDSLPKNAIITPHHLEFKTLFNLEATEKNVKEVAEKYNIVIVLKGETDIICSSESCTKVIGGNAGMTKGGTGDVLAGLIAALYCKNNKLLAASAGCYINKKAGEKLYEKVGIYFNSSDLAEEIPVVMKKLLDTLG